MSTIIYGLSLFFNENLLLFSLVILLFSFLLSYRSFPLIVYISRIKNLTATPNERSSHETSIPHLGGLGISFGAFFVSGFFGSFMLSANDMSILLSITASIVILFTAGVKDDIMGLSPSLKLMAEVLSAFIFIVLTDIRIDNFYGIFGIYEISTFISYLFTVFVFVVVINSFNLIDGIDGLAASVAIIILCHLCYYFYKIGLVVGLLSASATIGGLLAFLRFNISKGKRKIFMGDVGSLVVGFILSFTTTMALSSKFNASYDFENKPIYILALFAFPFLDTIRVFILRGIKGNSPFAADKNHLHHKLLKYGYTHIQSTSLVILYCLLVIGISNFFFDNSINLHLLITIIVSVGLLALLLLFLSKKNKKLN
ncbi:MAG: MraY family glycosyltransferase [Flavobacteriales bacterium]|nr:MraY family glycosyltransferase [Flavobacteriales bacterium]